MKLQCLIVYIDFLNQTEQAGDDLRRRVGHAARVPVPSAFRTSERGDAGRDLGREVHPDDQHLQQRDGEDRQVLQETEHEAAHSKELSRRVREDRLGQVRMF